MSIILGIDPGSKHTGYGVLEANGDRLRHIDHGVISSKSTLDFNERLHHMAIEVQLLFEKYKPQITVVERIFLGKNADSAFKLGHIRGVCLFAATAAGTEIREYAARSVKKGITGSGAAEKEQVQMILFASLGIRAKAQLDASDALALAFYHARNIEVEKTLSRAEVLANRRRDLPQV